VLNFLVLLYIALLYVRPAEIYQPLNRVPIVQYVSGVSALSGIVSLLLQPRNFISQPQDKYFLAFWLAITISNPAWGWLEGGWEAFVTFAPVVFCYLLIRLGVRTQPQLDRTIRLFVLLNVFLAVNGILQFKTGYSLWGVEALESPEGRRIKGPGIFSDPNDLGMTMVMAVPFVLDSVISPGIGVMRRLVAGFSLSALVLASVFTNSRGTVLGLATVFAVMSYRRFGAFIGTALGLTAVVALLAFGSSRTSDLSTGETSAQGRIQAWAAGYQMVKSRPLTGVGFGRFTDFHELVAHNSFVNTIAELGIIGAVCFVGGFVCLFRGLARIGSVGAADAIRRSAMGLAVCMCFLSRQYTVVVYVLFALGGSQLAIAEASDPALRTSAVKILPEVVAWTLGVTLLFWIFSRTFVSL
jgi:O-antigen ligase